MTLRLIAPLVLILLLSACAPAPAPSGAGAPSASSTPTPAPTAVVDVPIVSSTLQPARAALPPVRVQIADKEIDMEVVPVGVEPGGFMELPPDPLGFRGQDSDVAVRARRAVTTATDAAAAANANPMIQNAWFIASRSAA